MKCHISLVVPTRLCLYNVLLCDMNEHITLQSRVVIALVVFKPLDN